MTLHLLDCQVEQRFKSMKDGRERITLITPGIPAASLMGRLEDNGWRIEVQPVPVNRFRGCQAYMVTFVSIPGMTPLQPK